MRDTGEKTGVGSDTFGASLNEKNQASSTNDKRKQFFVRKWKPQERGPSLFLAALLLSSGFQIARSKPSSDAVGKFSLLGNGGRSRTTAESMGKIPFWRHGWNKLQAAVTDRNEEVISGGFKSHNDSPLELPHRESREQFHPDQDDYYDNEDAFATEQNRRKDGVPALGGALAWIFSDPKQLALISMKAVQYTILLFLLKSMWKALSGALEEVSQETLGGDPYFCSRSALPHVLKFLEDPTTASSVGHLPAHALIMARDLHLAGVPLQTPPSSGRASIQSLLEELTRSEASVLQQCLWKPPAHIRERPEVLWDSVVGLDDVKEQLLLTATASVPSSTTSTELADDSFIVEQNQERSLLERTQQAYSSILSTGSGASSTSTSEHQGILLYGPPGGGKSLLAQALAAKLGWPCLVVMPSVLFRKYVGETNLQVRALFSLVQNKLSPCIVVIDELDGLLRERHDTEHDSARELKTEFMQWLSGVMPPNSKGIKLNNNGSHQRRYPLIVIGASNRPFDIDSAVLRRLPQRFFIGYPDYNTRCELMKQLLHDVPTEADLDVDSLSNRCAGYSPADIQQALQTAVRLGPMKKALIAEALIGENGDSSANPVSRLSTQDILDALTRTHATPLSPNYRQALQKFVTSSGGGNLAFSLDGDTYTSHGLNLMNMGTVQVPFESPTSDYSGWQEKDDTDDEEESLDDDEFITDFDEDD